MRRGFFQDLPLFPQDSILAPQPPQLLALLGGQAILALAFIQISLLEPLAQGLRRHA
jgi:hypothetical protein